MSAHPRPPLRAPSATSSGTRPQVACDLAWIGPDGGVHHDTRLLPLGEAVAAATAMLPHGAILRTEAGSVAIEDLCPGMRVAVHGGAFARVVWIGSRKHVPRGDRPLGYRIAAHAFGSCGPGTDLVLGAAAHVLIASPRCRALVGGLLAFAPVAAFEDGRSVAAIVPQGAVETFGFACARQEAASVEGLWLESITPARAGLGSLRRETRADMARLLPHLRNAASTSLRLPCLTSAEARMLAVDGLTRG